MALPHEIPVAKPDISDPAYLRFVWARYLRQEAALSPKKKVRVIVISAEGALEIANLLDPAPPVRVGGKK